jgi:DNA-binding NarL/FixJ family response regulator
VKTINLAVLEDERLLRDRYAEMIASAGDMRLLWSAGSIAEALQAMNGAQPAGAGTPNVLLVDLGLPDGSGLAVIARAKRLYPDCEVMVVSVFGDEDHVVAAIEAGASGYLLKDTLRESFLGTIRELLTGGSPISPSIARILLNRARTPGSAPARPSVSGIDLAERESQILGLVSKGFNFNEISGLLGVSPNTVKTHIYRIYRKLAVHSRGEAVFEARKLGLLED